jgi:hypothetical protein
MGAYRFPSRRLRFSLPVRNLGNMFKEDLIDCRSIGARVDAGAPQKIIVGAKSDAHLEPIDRCLRLREGSIANGSG